MNNNGQTIVEVLIVSLIVTVSLVGGFSLFSQFYLTNQIRSEQVVATYLAAEGLELIKNKVDSNKLGGAAFNSGLIDCSGGCTIDYRNSISSGSGQLYIDQSGLYSHNNISGNQTPYSRIIYIDSISGGLKAKSQVDWITRRGPFKVELDAYFYDWR
ncbi:hypothetical protein HZC33_02950 [Candidatus Wolfebacteria bacterium]|nr:hypothetical protein [Candidatus Wolfebacteria bacterium]